jgi:hypothetical protein
MGIIEQLGESSYLLIEGDSAASFDASGFTAPFRGRFLHCPNLPIYTTGEYWTCSDDVQGSSCDSGNHQLSLVRR